MSLFRRRAAVAPTRAAFQVSVYEPEAAKAAEFHPSVIQTLLAEYGGWYGSTYGAMYRKQPAVRAVVDFLARNVAQLNAKVYERVSNTDRVEVGDHPLAVLLQHPNPTTTRYRHMRGTVADLAIYDRAYWRKIRVGRSLAVARISPARLFVEIDDYAGTVVYRTVEGVEIPRSQLVIFPGYSPDSGEEGVSPLETLRRVMLEEINVGKHREAMWKNAASSSGVVSRPTDAPAWSDTARQRFRADLEATIAGTSNAGRVTVLEEGMTWTSPSWKPPDTEYINSRRLTYEEVAIVYFGPIGGRAWLDAATQGGSEENHRQMYQDVLGPMLEQLQEEIELQLLPEVQPLGQGSTYVEFNLAAKLKGSFEEQARVATTATGVPSVTVNETRARMNLPRIDDDRFDMPVMPMNVIYGGQPAVTIPTEDRSTPPKPPTMALGPGRKAAPRAAVSRRDRVARDHEELLRKFFGRQEQAIKSAKGKADRGRWDRELQADLYGLATQVTRTTGKLAARQLNGVYNVEQTLNYLSENARIAAESINAETFDLLAADEADPAAVFDVAKGSRSERIGLGRATLLINFARTEAGKQSQAADGRERTKTWVVTSSKSRHPEMGGETVAVSDDFSNGLAWPGAAGGSAAQVAGCQCLLRLD